MNFSHVQSEDSSLLMENTKLTRKEHKILTSVKNTKPSARKHKGPNTKPNSSRRNNKGANDFAPLVRAC